jgi:phosphatidylserine/phosphatidylglycerophosphate/cardiolipin synthase-like enzyme
MSDDEIALLNSHKRNVKVDVILDKSQRSEKYSEADFLVNMGIPTKIDAKHAIAHNKIMMIDGQTVITGRFNFTKAAEENNAENLVVIRDTALAEKYTANWQAHAAHSDPYEVREKGYSETHRAAASETPKNDAVPPVAGGYVASARSQVFHRADCKSAAEISEKNLVHYASREEAIQAGKKPCHECNP